MIVGQTDIDDVDVVWAAGVLPRHHGVQCSTVLVCGSGVMQHQTVA